MLLNVSGLNVVVQISSRGRALVASLASAARGSGSAAAALSESRVDGPSRRAAERAAAAAAVRNGAALPHRAAVRASSRGVSSITLETVSHSGLSGHSSSVL